MTLNNVSGGCMCGAVRYEADQPQLFTALCHCRMCQRWTGSPMFGSAAFVRESISFTKGEPKTHKSSAVCERGFCADCGSSLFTLYSSGGVFDTVIFIGVGTFDDPEIAPPDVHYGAESELSWMHRDDGIPRIAIDVDDPAEQNALLEKLLIEGANRRTRDTSQPG